MAGNWAIYSMWDFEQVSGQGGGILAKFFFFLFFFFFVFMDRGEPNKLGQ